MTQHIIIMSLICLCGLSMFTSVAAATYHVDASATKPEDGTPDAPFRTIQKAVRVLKPGDTCMVHAGVYRETVGEIPSGTGYVYVDDMGMQLVGE